MKCWCTTVKASTSRETKCSATAEAVAKVKGEYHHALRERQTDVGTTWPLQLAFALLTDCDNLHIAARLLNGISLCAYRSADSCVNATTQTAIGTVANNLESDSVGCPFLCADK